MIDQDAALAAVKDYLLGLQDRIAAGLNTLDSTAFHEDRWDRAEGGGGRSRVLAGGPVFEQAGVNFSDVTGSPSDQNSRAAAFARWASRW